MKNIRFKSKYISQKQVLNLLLDYLGQRNTYNQFAPAKTRHLEMTVRSLNLKRLP